jgi:integrase
MKPCAEKTPSGKTVWRINYRVDKRRVRKTFHSRDEARDWIADNYGIAESEGRLFWQAWRNITPAERHELMDSLVLMREHRKTHAKSSIVVAVKTHISREESIKTSLLLRDAVDRYLASKLNSKRKGSVSGGWYEVLELCLKRVVRELPAKSLVEFSTEEIEEYLDDQDWSARTFNNYHAYISGLYRWGIENNFAILNPTAKIEKYAKKFITKEVIVPDVGKVGRILKLARKEKYFHLRPGLDLGFGLAMRSSEISKMVWENVTELLVHVPNSVGKGGRGRNIARRPLLDGVFSSLIAQKGTGQIMPKGWRRDLTELFLEVGLGKPRNVLRKSGGSYHYHATGDEALTQEMMGHTEDSNIFGSCYKALRFGDVLNKTPIGTADGLAYYRLWKAR